ncbi:hypothetical protein DMB37_04825 [Nocardia sp. CS682]|nr:hypothetical protein DMB37_04825 [Nocardia sp. CS682]
MEAAAAARPQQRTAAEGCQVYWPAPYEVCGAIRDKYNELGGPNSFLLFPTSNELTNPDGVGKRSTFQNGPIYWSPAGGAHPVANHFFAAWQRNGWEGGVLGYPTSDELVNPDNIGRRQYFQGGTIYWKLNEAYYVAGTIRDKWGETGWETGWLGYPTSDETKTADGVGRFNRFDKGVIYWSPNTGAHPVAGLIQVEWGSEQYEAGMYGYPTSDERSAGGSSREQDFQNGRIRVPTPVNGGSGPDEDAITGPVGPGGNDYTGPSGVNRTGSGARPGTTLNEHCRKQTEFPTSDGTLYGCASAAYLYNSGVDTRSAPPTLSPPISLQPGCDADYQKKRSDYLAGRTNNLAIWTFDRLYACAVNPIGAVIRTDQGKVTAYVNGKLEQELITHYDSPKSQYRVRFSVEKIVGVFTLTANAPCTGGPCPVTVYDSMVSEPLSDGAQPFAFYEFGPDSVNPNQRIDLIMGLNLAFASPGAREKTPGDLEIKITSPYMRCDNDTAVPGAAGLPSQGCVFADRIPTLDFASDNRLAPIANHVKRAQQSGLPGAGKLYYTGPLTRMTDENQRQRNGARACPSGRYSVPDHSCDEYPFRSTYQGAAQPPNAVLPPNGRTFPGCQINDTPRVDPSRTGPNGYSVCMVPTTPEDANNLQAIAIREFYYKNRVRDGDKFYVRADTGQ